MSKRVKKDLQEMKDMLHEMNNNAKIKSKITCENVPVSQLKHDDNNEENLNTFLFDNIELTNHNHFCDNIDGDQLIKEADILIDTTVDTSTLEPSSAINSNEQVCSMLLNLLSQITSISFYFLHNICALIL